jgi:hypothetical protein
MRIHPHDNSATSSANSNIESSRRGLSRIVEHAYTRPTPRRFLKQFAGAVITRAIDHQDFKIQVIVVTNNRFKARHYERPLVPARNDYGNALSKIASPI